ncbi:phage terminase small subunit [Stutzerimonas kunmingensis]|uniref:phage terminase small subunit n=1 Tax=Stutzerimonas kunmingensis TaxID=1211807 RepID=UPI0021058DCC|nr:phage terminase small subunit [Stutzerimonas kunmingensis]MCQ2035166.1 phage terminase small subunit [Stutzerimonas kunmingensis]
MSLSPAQINQLRKRAALEAAATAPAQTMAGATTYELQLAQLHQDRLRLSQIQSTEGKVALKAQLLPAYVPYVDGVLAGGRGAQDDVLTTVMLWRLDAADYFGALAIGRYVLEHNMTMPDRFQRTTGCLLAEEVAEAALKAQKAGGRFDTQVLIEAEQLTREQDMPDEARAKLHLAIGRALVADLPEDNLTGPEDNLTGPEADQLETARANIARAIELHGSCGGKKDLERVQRLLKKHADSKPAETGNGEPPANDQPPSEQDESQSSEEGTEAETDTGEPSAN